MLLTNAVNTEGRLLEIYVKDGKIAAVGRIFPPLPPRTRRWWMPVG